MAAGEAVVASGETGSGLFPPQVLLPDEEELSGCLLCATLPVPYHPQAFWGLEFTAAYREAAFLPAN